MQRVQTQEEAYSVKLIPRFSKTIARIKRKRELKQILKTIDLDALRSYRGKYDSTPYGDSKYWDVENRIALNLVHAHKLSLHRLEPLSLLDIGTGCGYFPYICGYYGHEVIGVDVDTPMYNDVTSFLKLDVREWRVNAFEKLPDLGGRFDLVSALLCFFNKPWNKDVWGVDEWFFFLKDLATNQLTEKGRVFLKLNRQKDGRYYNRKLRNFFVNCGAKVDGGNVYFKSLQIPSR